MDRRNKGLRSICRLIGEDQRAVTEWYLTLPEEQQREWNYPLIVWREFNRAKLRPGARKKRTKHEEATHRLEEQHAETVAALHAANTDLKAENTELRATISSVEKMIRAVLDLGRENARAVAEGVLAELERDGNGA